MDERHANIDLAFRNGLKDYEVLPPPDVWNGIEHRMVRKERPLYFMRAAAFLAIAMTLSVLAYRWMGKISTRPENRIIALNEESSSPASTEDLSLPVSQKLVSLKSPGLPEKTITVSYPDISQTPVPVNEAASFVKLPETNLRLPFNNASLDIIRHKSEISVLPATNLTVDDVSQEYQEFLAEDVPVNRTNRWSIAALASPTYYGKINTGSDELSQQIMASEKSVISYTGGVALSYNVNKRITIQSGLFYSSVGQELDGINSFSGFQKYDYTKGGHNFEVLTTNGTIYTNNADVFLFAQGNRDRLITNYNNDVFDPQKASLDYINNSLRQSFSYLELPVFLRYKLIDRTVDFNLIGGVSYNLLVDNEVYTVIDGGKYMIGTTEGLNMFSISSSLGMGMEYKFSEKFSFNLEPTFRYYINTFNNVAGSTFHPYSFGIFSGISYKF
jgi:hypothetical protein